MSSFKITESKKEIIKKSDQPYIEIELIKGLNLPARDLTGKSDPYIIFKCDKESVKSSTKYQTLNPIWNEKFIFYVPVQHLKEKGILEIECWDWDPLKSSDYMGKILFSIKDLPKDHKVSKSLKLDMESGLIELTFTARNFGVESPEDVKEEKVLTTIKDPLQAVLNKLENSLYATQFKNKEDLSKFASILSNPDKLKTTYLSTKWADTLIMDEELKNNQEEQEEEEKFIDTTTQQLKNDIKVKILIVDQDAKSQLKQNLRMFLSPVLSKIEMVPTMGMFHTAIMIGPWLIEWNNSALCIPRKCVSRAAMLSADIDAIHTIKSLDTVVDNLANHIVQWNISKLYKTQGGDKKLYGNCQDFIDSLLNSIGIKLNFQGPLADFLKNIKDNGSTQLEFRVNQEFKEKFKINEKSKVFQTHQELDEFVHKLFEVDMSFDKKYPHEYAFIKSFDRAFWMRFFKISEEISKTKQKLERMNNILEQQKSSLSDSDLANAQKEIDKVKKDLSSLQEEEKKVKPYEKKVIDEEDNTEYFEESCPFKDPRDTKSIII